ncbi:MULTISPECIES: hypothetical protein [unclassified Sinorhizobium]|uniref:hypothetical protein n=1 Tax=unclassified Sinorhizobium TaxID=2613772 RepID=UPI0035266D5B
MTRLMFAVVAAMMLTACHTKTVEEMSYSERKALAAEIAKRCYAQGVKPGSSEYEACSTVEVQREVATRRREAAWEDAATAAAAGADRGPRTCQNFSGNVVCF